MGRHGGGSRSGGGGSSSRSSGGSRSGGGSGARSSTKPFLGAYDRSYCDRFGRYHSYYTTDRDFGTKPGWDIGTIISLIFLTVHMLIMLGAFCADLINFGGKVNGDINRIKIVDTVNVLTISEEESVLKLLNDVYDKSGMPVTVYTDDFEWKEKYYSLQIYSEELYYQMGYDEDAMIILFTTDNNEEFWDWEYDMYCGDDTIKCLSDPAFDKLLDNFQKAMANQNLVTALDYAWNSVIDDLAKTTIDSDRIVSLILLALIYVVVYVSVIKSAVKGQSAYRYFKLKKSQSVDTAQVVMHGECPKCGAANTMQQSICPYCGSVLTISDDKNLFVSAVSENKKKVPD